MGHEGYGSRSKLASSSGSDKMKRKALHVVTAPATCTPVHLVWYLSCSQCTICIKISKTSLCFIHLQLITP